MLLRVKSFVWQLVYASKSTFFLIQIAVHRKLGIKISDPIKRIVTRGEGGAEKAPKKCQVIFKCPLIVILQDKTTRLGSNCNWNVLETSMKLGSI
jgi:hypothetical protein